MTEKDKVSIIVPVYKAENFLSKCVDSILNQSYRNIQVILVDDGSPDLSGDLCDKYAARDSRVLALHKLNGGVSSARNLGMKHMEGEFVLFIDSDDWLDADYIANLMRGKEQPLVITGFKRHHHCEGILEPESEQVVNIEKLLPELWGKWPKNFIYWYVWGKMYRTDVILENNLTFNQDLIYDEDFCFVMEYMSLVDTYQLIKSHSYNHIYETGRSEKFMMNHALLRQHIQIHEKSFNQLEKKCNFDFPIIRTHVYKRMLPNFVAYLKTCGMWQYVKQCRAFTSDKDPGMVKAFDLVVNHRWKKGRRRLFKMIVMFPVISYIFKLTNNFKLR